MGQFIHLEQSTFSYHWQSLDAPLQLSVCVKFLQVTATACGQPEPGPLLPVFIY
jgi:hypothetical protein